MPPETLADRVRFLEHKMLSLEGLPDRVASLEGQISQFRAEVRVEFSAVREEMRAHGETLRSEMRVQGETLRGEMRDGDEETRRHMRVLHEEVIARIALLDEHLRGRERSPDSRGHSWPRTSLRSWSPAPSARRYSARSACVSRDHGPSSNACRAAATARGMSAGAASAIV